MLHTALGKVQPFKHGAPAKRHQEMRAVYGRLAARAFGVNRDVARMPIHPGGLVPFEDRDAFAAQRLDGQLCVRFVSASKRAVHFQHCHLRAEAHESLCQFETDGAAAEHHEVLRKLRQGKDGLVGEIGQVRESGDRRNEGAAAGGHDDPARFHAGGLGDNRIAVLETRGFADDRAAETFEPFLAVDRRNRLDRLADVCLDAVPVD